MYIYRELQDYFKSKMSPNEPFGCILSGVVGCGKTTLVEKVLSDLENQYEIFRFTGDDIQFRQLVAQNSQSILEHVFSRTTKKSLVFVDEVQKSENIFDALKIAFDSKKISFIVSGSNPAFLSTVAKRRLQRRAEQVFMLPLSLPEILLAKKLISNSQRELFSQIVFGTIDLHSLPLPELSLNETMKAVIKNFLNYGGLPLAYLAENFLQKLTQVRLTVERGFEPFSVGNNMVSELVKLELAQLNSQEFTYQNILQKTRLRKRDDINLVIDDLINNGYLVKKKPILLKANKSSYLSVFSYIDPGMLTYLRGGLPKNEELGYVLEGYIHARLDYYIKNNILKSELGYFKPHVLDHHGKIKYSPGEIDFVLLRHERILPMEVKLTEHISNIETSQLTHFLKTFRQAKFGIIFYGGVPYKDLKKKLLYWPYWLV